MRVLFIVPEFGKGIYGGLGTVLYGLAFPLSCRIELDILSLENCYPYAFQQGFASCLLHEMRDGKVNTKLIPLKSLSDAFHLLQGYDILHFFHYSLEIAEFIRLIRAHSLPSKIVFSCHYLLKYEQHTRCIHRDLLKIEEYIYANVDHVHVLNRTSYDIFTSHYPAVGRKVTIFTIPNGVGHYGYAENFQLGEPINQQLKESDFLVLTITRWCHGKGLECLMDAIPSVLAKYPDVKFIIGGRKENSWENQGQEYVKKIDEKIFCLKDKVFALGWLEKKEIGSLMQRAKLWVFPSELEYFPYGLLEPMIYQVPIVTAQFAGFSEIIEEDRECLAFRPGFPYELAEKIVYLIENQELRNRLAMNAYTKAATKYDWNAIAVLYADMYSTIKKRRFLTHPKARDK